MKYTMESDFAKHVKSSEQHNVYLLYGGQAYLIALYEKMIVKRRLAERMKRSICAGSTAIRSIYKRFTMRSNRSR